MMNKLPGWGFVIVFLMTFNSGCSKGEKYIKKEGMIWNTVYHITYKGNPELKDSILPLLNEVSKSLSVFDKNSLVTRLNNSDSVKADRHLLVVYDYSKKINALSEGHFDPTLSPLIDAWGFGKGHLPTKDTLSIDSIMHFVGLDKTWREGENIFKEDKRINFNFSAIAKGYGCDILGEMFKRNGVKDYMVEIGGEIILSGKSPSNNDWRIAIDNPEEGKNPGEDTAMILEVTDVGIATSGNYRNFREENGTKTAHTISPVTGRPFNGEILSATIIAPTCMEADGLATACMAGSVEEAKLIIKNSEVKGILITENGVWKNF